MTEQIQQETCPDCGAVYEISKTTVRPAWEVGVFECGCGRVLVWSNEGPDYVNYRLLTPGTSAD